MQKNRIEEFIDPLLAYLSECRKGKRPNLPKSETVQNLINELSGLLNVDFTLFEQVFNCLPYQLAIIDATGNLVAINNSWYNFAANNPEILLTNVLAGANYLDVCSNAASDGENTAANAFDGIQSLISGEKLSYEIEYPCHTPATKRWCMLTANKIGDKGNHIVLAHSDVTQAYLANIQIQENEARFHYIMDKMIDGVQIIGFDWRYIYLNETALLQSRYPRNEIIGYTMEEKYPGIKKSDLYKKLKECMTRRTTMQFENEFFYPDKSSEWFEIRVQPNSEGLFILSVDITDKKRTERLLAQNRANYNRVLENISDGIVMTDANNKVIFANDRFFELIGLEDTNLDNFQFNDYVLPEYIKILDARHSLIMAGEEIPVKFTYEGIRKDGKKRWFEVLVAKIIENNIVVGTQSAIRDITEEKIILEKLKNSEAEKSKLLDELTNKYNEQMQFNYIVSHNLRSPIANIIGLTQVLNYPVLKEEEKKTYIEGISNAAVKMNNLVKDLNKILSMSSQLNEKIEDCSISLIVDNAIHVLEKQISQAGASVNVYIALEAENINTIKSYFESIIYNLISNALKYKSKQRKPRVDINVNKSNNITYILVSDNGIGINMEKDGKNLFGLYKRFNFDVEGKGLGLHMTKIQVEAMGGEISVDSQVEVGSTFKIRLPHVNKPK